MHSSASRRRRTARFGAVAVRSGILVPQIVACRPRWAHNGGWQLRRLLERGLACVRAKRNPNRRFALVLEHVRPLLTQFPLESQLASEVNEGDLFKSSALKIEIRIGEAVCRQD